ncbi:MAG TPA: hypothetical protein VGO57_10500 [Verrucomicrobiae bacterium]
MKSKMKVEVHRFPLNLLYYGNAYYLEQIVELEKVLARKPRRLQLDLMGSGEISAEWAMLIREILSQRSPKTCLITNARSTLKNGSVLVWLQGDQRLMTPNVRLFFREAEGAEEEPEGEAAKVWNESELKYANSESDPDEIAHARVLQLINEYLPVAELTGKMIGAATLREFGLVDNAQLDRFLTEAFRPGRFQPAKPTDMPKKAQTKAKSANPVPPQK